MKKYFFIVIYLLLLGAAAHYFFLWNPFKPLKTGTVLINGMERKFYYHLPARLIQKPKLVFALHGSDMRAKTMRMVTGNQLDNFADSSGAFIVVYPQGYKKYWNDCRTTATYPAKKQAINDLEFFSSMISYFSQKYMIDSTNVYAFGYSNGGHMCYKLAKQVPHLFRAFAVIGASLPAITNDDCTSFGQPVSMLIINGTVDPVNPYNGGEVVLNDGQRRGAVMSTENTMKYWMKLAGCTQAFAQVFHQNGKQLKLVKSFSCNMATGKKVHLIKVISGGHNTPNPRFFLWPSKVGAVNKELNAPLAVMEFFSQH